MGNTLKPSLTAPLLTIIAPRKQGSKVLPFFCVFYLYKIIFLFLFSQLRFYSTKHKKRVTPCFLCLSAAQISNFFSYYCSQTVSELSSSASSSSASSAADANKSSSSTSPRTPKTNSSSLIKSCPAATDPT